MRDAPDLVLASASPRRADLLRQLGLTFRIEPSFIPEDLLPGEAPEAHVERLSQAKAREVWERNRSSLVLAGDTIVVLGGQVLGKPSSAAEALDMLMALSGRTHTVVSGLALCFPDGSLHSGFERTGVTFRSFDEATAAAYVSTGEPMDKAGAYGIQGLGSALVEGVNGDYHTVVGLPVPLLLELFSKGGLHYDFGGLVYATQEKSR